jgi:SAM-dependent methyltransferase
MTNSSSVRLPVYLNLGCGSLFHPDWQNLDLGGDPKYVTKADIRKRLPFEDNSVDACYHSHVLEHLTASDGKGLLKECFRVLKPKGILRVVVPDLEASATHYLSCLENVRRARNPETSGNYEWAVIELIDQLTRERGGGLMAGYLRNPPAHSRTFITERMGLQVQAENEGEAAAPNIVSRLRRNGLVGVIRKIREQAFLATSFITLGTKGYKAAKVALFRELGEIHKWMYDSYSLIEILKEVGFVENVKKSAFESSIPNFTYFQLDTAEGLVRKPNSLYVEGIKP